MPIKSIKLSNFKSFDETYVELGKFNIIIGANASGKSNLIQVLRFLRDIKNYGLDNAISLQGGIEYLRNTNINTSQELVVDISFDDKFGRIITKDEQQIVIKVSESNYRFAIKFNKKGFGFKVTEDRLIQRCQLVKIDEKGKNLEKSEDIADGEIILFKNGQESIEMKFKCEKKDFIHINESDIFPLPFYLIRDKIKPNLMLFETPFFLFLMPSGHDSFSNYAIYDFDPKIPKKATPITGKSELEEDGSNLAIVVKNIIKSSNDKRKFSNLLREVLPFIKDIKIEDFTDKSYAKVTSSIDIQPL